MKKQISILVLLIVILTVISNLTGCKSKKDDPQPQYVECAASDKVKYHACIYNHTSDTVGISTKSRRTNLGSLTPIKIAPNDSIGFEDTSCPVEGNYVDYSVQLKNGSIRSYSALMNTRDTVKVYIE